MGFKNFFQLVLLTNCAWHQNFFWVKFTFDWIWIWHQDQLWPDVKFYHFEYKYFIDISLWYFNLLLFMFALFVICILIIIKLSFNFYNVLIVVQIDDYMSFKNNKIIRSSFCHKHSRLVFLQWIMNVS